MKKEIRVEKLRVGDLKHGFGNPRKITRKKKEELERSLELLGDFGIFVIDEDDNIIAGNQRATILNEKDPDTVVTCKRLIGYTDAEKRAINIKDNTHAGDWDYDILADWTSDLTIDLGLKEEAKKEMEERKIPEMELIHYEKYDYVLIVCRTSLDYDELTAKLGLTDAKVSITKKRKIKGRAVWYDKIRKVLFGYGDKVSDTREADRQELP